MATILTPNPGQPFNVEQNKVRNSTSGSWTAIADDEFNADRGVLVHGVKWDGVSGKILQIRDREGDIWYDITSTGDTDVDQFASARPLYTKFEYLSSTVGSTIIIYGTYI